MAKPDLKRKAISLRRKGWSYREIREVLPVAKSTLSLWLSAVSLTSEQRKRLHTLRPTVASREKAAKVLAEKYTKLRQDAVDAARVEFEDVVFDYNAAVLVGAALYWAEGGKKATAGLDFSNSDPYMVRAYVWWLVTILKVPKDHITCKISVWLNNDVSYEEVQSYWEKRLSLASSQFEGPHINTVFNKITTQSRKTVLTYGVVLVRVRKPLQYKAKYVALMEKMGKSLDFVNTRKLE